MRAMLLEAPRHPLRLTDRPSPKPGPDQVLIRISACGVCRTDLHILDGELGEPRLPLIPGHEIVGTVAGVGPRVREFDTGQRVRVPSLRPTCGCWEFCGSGRENPGKTPQFT